MDWVDKVSQDVNAEMINAFKEQNRILQEQNAELRKQLDEIKTQLGIGKNTSNVHHIPSNIVLCADWRGTVISTGV